MLSGNRKSIDGYASRILNHTFTAMATRLLRLSILAPITGDSLNLRSENKAIYFSSVPSAIDARLDVVEGEALKFENSPLHKNT